MQQLYNVLCFESYVVKGNSFNKYPFFKIRNDREEDGEWNGRVLLREINFIALRVQLLQFSKLKLFGFKHTRWFKYDRD